jgi:hypothetical protein
MQEISKNLDEKNRNLDEKNNVIEKDFKKNSDEINTKSISTKTVQTD